MNYSDGDVETVWLAAERVRLALAPGEALPAPGPDALCRLALQLQAGAGTAEHRTLPPTSHRVALPADSALGSMVFLVCMGQPLLLRL